MKKRNQIPLSLFALIFSLQSASPAYALAIREYIDGALKSNPSVEGAYAKVRSAEIGVAAAKAAYLPKAMASLSYNRNSMDGSPVSTQMTTLSPTLSASWVLWDSGVRKHSLELARLTAKSSELNFATVRQALMVQTLKTYALWDQQSSMEYAYQQLIVLLDKVIEKARNESRVSDKAREILQAKREEWLQKKTGARVMADSLAIQVDGLTGIEPKPYSESTKEEIAEIAKFYEDLLLNRPLPPLSEALSLLAQNNLTLKAARYGVDTVALSQSLQKAAMTGLRVSVNASIGSTKTQSQMTSAMGVHQNENSQSVKTVGVMVSIPLDPEAYQNLNKNRYELTAAKASEDQLRKDLEIALKMAHRNISLLRDSLKSDLAGLKIEKNFEFRDYSEQEVTNLLAIYNAFEQRYAVLNNQMGILFSSTIDLINLIYDLDLYLRELK